MITATSPPPQNPPSSATSGEPPSPISFLPDDLLLMILSLLLSAADPRILTQLSSVSRRFYRILRSPLPSSLPLPLPPSVSLPYPTLHKLTFCCPGLLHATATVTSTPTWCPFDDLFLDFSNDLTETLANAAHGTDSANLTPSETVPADTNTRDRDCSSSNRPLNFTDTNTGSTSFKRRMNHGPTGSHLARGNWSLSRKYGRRLLASEFRGDSLYICDWPGCVHLEEKRNYMLFRGVFEDFNESRVWKKIMDSNLGKIKKYCAYCSCNEMWDLHLVECLADNFMKFHGDGEPFVRAFVCDNGHVSGAWTGK